MKKQPSEEGDQPALLERLERLSSLSRNFGLHALVSTDPHGRKGRGREGEGIGCASHTFAWCL